MNWTSQEENRIKRYWLGDLPDAEQRQVEDRLVDDDDYEQQAHLIEQELIDDYARGALGASDRLLFESNFPLTPERQTLLRLARCAIAYAAVANQPDQPAQITVDQEQSEAKTAAGGARFRAARRGSGWRHFFFTPGLQWGGLAILVLGLGVGIWFWRSRAPEAAAELARTRDAINRAAPRSYEPRLSKLAYASFVVQMGDSTRDKSASELEHEENRLRLQLRRRPDASIHYALGQVQLARKRLESARAEFDAALRLSAQAGTGSLLTQPHQAQLHNDLGATLMELWSREQSRGEKPGAVVLQRQSLEEFATAIILDEQLLEARFNRALLYERAGQASEARAAWDDYLARESDQDWKREAQEHRSSLK